MRGFNKAIIMGNLARDPEIRYTASQRAVASFSVAVNRQWKDQNGEIRDEVVFIPVVVWGKGAEVCERYLKKGSGVLVEGRINVRSYESKTGEKRYVTEIVADTFQFVGGKRDDSQSSGYGESRDSGESGRGGYGESRSSRGGYSSGRGSQAPRSFRDSMGSRQQPFGDNAGGYDAVSFPMDISQMDDPSSSGSDDEADIPF